MVAIKSQIKLQRYASSKVEAAIKTGKLKKEACVLCGKDIADAHHPDYTKPLFVIWLCHKCHTRHHQDLEAIEILPLLNEYIKTYLFEQNQRKIQNKELLRGRNKRFFEIYC